MRKTRRNRPIRKERLQRGDKVELPKVKYVEVKTKSRAGVEYTKFKEVYPANPSGSNHLARRKNKAFEKKIAKLIPNEK